MEHREERGNGAQVLLIKVEKYFLFEIMDFVDFHAKRVNMSDARIQPYYAV